MLYLVSYDLNKPIQNYPKLDAFMKQLGGIRVLESEWLVPTNAQPVTFHNQIQAGGGLDGNDRLLVTEVTKTSAWNNLLIPDATAQGLFGHARA